MHTALAGNLTLREPGLTEDNAADVTSGCFFFFPRNLNLYILFCFAVLSETANRVGKLVPLSSCIKDRNLFSVLFTTII